MPSYVSAALTFLLTVLPVICILVGAWAFTSGKANLVKLAVGCAAGWVVFSTLLVGMWTYIGSTTPDCRYWLSLIIAATVALNVGAAFLVWKLTDPATHSPALSPSS